MEQAKERANRIKCTTAGLEDMPKDEVFFNVDIPVLIIDPHTYQVTAANPSAQELHGTLLPGQTCYQYTHKFSQPCSDMANFCPVKMALEHHRSAIVEHCYYSRDGSKRDIRIEGHPVFDEYGNVKSVIEFEFDVTELKKVQKNSEQIRLAVDNAGDAILIMDNQGRVNYSNMTFGDMLRFTPFDIEEEGADIIFADENLAHSVFEQAYRGENVQVETKLVTKEGDKFSAHLMVSPIIDERVELTGMLFIIRDITEQVENERRLKEAASQWRTTFDSISDMISIIDTQGKIVKVNKAFADFFDSTPSAIIGKTCHKILHNISNHISGCPLLKSVKNKEKAKLEYYDEERQIYLGISTYPIFSDSGEVIGVVHISKDITLRREMEQKKSDLLDEISSINQELNKFAYIISHDLKAPLRGISGLTNILYEDYKDKFDAEGKETLDLIMARADKMQGLIDGVLQYSRVGRIKEKHVEVDLSVLVPEIIDLLAVPRHIKITIESELPTVTCEKTRILQVFQNLLSNAIKYMDKEEGLITINCERDGGFWKFSVADNGPGIPEDKFEMVFELFRTLQKTESTENTGVGLTIIKKIVELYGGRIWVESKVGEGATFIFTLPVEVKQKPDNQEQAD